MYRQNAHFVNTATNTHLPLSLPFSNGRLRTTDPRQRLLPCQVRQVLKDHLEGMRTPPSQGTHIDIIYFRDVVNTHKQ